MHSIIKSISFLPHSLIKKDINANHSFARYFRISALNERMYRFQFPKEYVETENEEELNEENSVLRKRNKSGLRDYHYKIAHKQVPNYTGDDLEVMSLRQYRKLYGRYGKAADIDMKTLWPSIQELEVQKEREKLEFPYSVHEMIAMAKKDRLEKEREIMERQEEIKQNLKNLEKWKKDVRDRMEKKEKEATRLMVLKEKQIEEVREVLGYNISPFDPKFKEILDKKMEEDKKQKKKEKRLQKQQIELQKLMETAKEDAKVVNQEPNTLQGKRIE